MSIFSNTQTAPPGWLGWSMIAAIAALLAGGGVLIGMLPT